MNKFSKMLTAYKHGIKIPYQAMRAADEAGIPFAVMCAFLEQESYGGANVFGHDGGDDGWASGWGKVTKRKYLRYKEGRKAGKGMQGVGPMQLTWWEFQDRADAAGGCWKPYVNCLVGARILKSYWDSEKDWVQVGRRYNGALSYGYEVKAKITKWQGLLK